MDHGLWVWPRYPIFNNFNLKPNAAIFLQYLTNQTSQMFSFFVKFLWSSLQALWSPPTGWLVHTKVTIDVNGCLSVYVVLWWPGELTSMYTILTHWPLGPDPAPGRTFFKTFDKEVEDESIYMFSFENTDLQRVTRVQQHKPDHHQWFYFHWIWTMFTSVCLQNCRPLRLSFLCSCSALRK